MTLLNRSWFEPVFVPLKGREVAYLPLPGNCGDALIEMGTLDLLTSFEINHHVLDWTKTDRVDLILIAGGGSMGNHYPAPRQIRESALRIGKPVIVLPQTFTGPEDLPYTRVFVRERASLRFCPTAILAPDLALSLQVPLPPAPTREQGVWLRRDSEGCFARFPSLGDPAALAKDAAGYLKLAGAYSHIVTDRLHFAIAGLTQGRQVTLLPNRYFKNRAVYEAWLQPLGCRWAERPPTRWADSK